MAGPFPGCCCGLLHPHCSHQSADISDPTKMHKQNRKAVILTAQCHLISVLEVTNWSYFIFLFQVFSLFFLTNAAVTFPPGPAPPQKICSKGTGIKNKKSAVIALFEIIIIKIQKKWCFIDVCILHQNLWWQHSFISHSAPDNTHVSHLSCNIQTRFSRLCDLSDQYCIYMLRVVAHMQFF